MPTMRSPAEIDTLSAEAERRVRAGEPRADVARSLGVALSTLRDWAHKGGCRPLDYSELPDDDLCDAEDDAADREADAAAAASGIFPPPPPERPE